MTDRESSDEDRRPPSDQPAAGRHRRLTAPFRLAIDVGSVTDVTSRSPVGDEPSRSDAIRPTGTADYHVDTYRSADELTVVADLPGVSAADLSVKHGTKSNILVIAVRGTVLRRVSLPWNRFDVSRVWFNNGILEVRIRRPDGATDAG